MLTTRSMPEASWNLRGNYECLEEFLFLLELYSLKYECRRHRVFGKKKPLVSTYYKLTFFRLKSEKNVVKC